METSDATAAAPLMINIASPPRNGTPAAVSASATMKFVKKVALKMLKVIRCVGVFLSWWVLGMTLVATVMLEQVGAMEGQAEEVRPAVGTAQMAVMEHLEKEEEQTTEPETAVVEFPGEEEEVVAVDAVGTTSVKDVQKAMSAFVYMTLV